MSPSGHSRPKWGFPATSAFAPVASI